MPHFLASLDISPIVPAIVTIIACLLSIIALYNVHRINRAQQLVVTRTQVQLEFEKRYMALVIEDEAKLIAHLNDSRAAGSIAEQAKFQQSPNSHGESEYAKRYWTLQFHQFIQWSQGMIDHPTYCYWMRRRREEWQSNRRVGATDYQSMTEIGMKFQGNSVFEEFIDIVLKGEDGRRASALRNPSFWYRRFSEFEGGNS